MLKSLQRQLAQLFSSNQASADTPPIELAAAALMVEIATIDNTLDDRELQMLTQELADQFSLPEATLQQLIEDARIHRHDAVSLYPLTRTLNEGLDYEEKFTVLCSLWRVAFADKHLDKYEEYMIRKIADLLYMSQSDFIRAKHVARGL